MRAVAGAFLTLQSSLISDQELLCFCTQAQRGNFEENGYYQLLLLGFSYKSITKVLLDLQYVNEIPRRKGTGISMGFFMGMLHVCGVEGAMSVC